MLSLINRRKFHAPVQMAGSAAVGWDWNVIHQVVTRDSIHPRVTVLATRHTGPKSGLLTLGIQVCNQHGDCVQSGRSHIIARCQPTHVHTTTCPRRDGTTP